MINLDIHSIYSIKRSIIKMDDLFAYLKVNKQKAAALIDDNGLFGVIEFYFRCKKEHIKPLIGTQISLCEDVTRKSGNTYPITLLVKNIDGYKNLCKLITRANLEWFYYRPRIDWKTLAEYRDGLICLGGPRTNPVAGPLLENQLEYAQINNQNILDIFGNDYHPMIHPYTDEEYKKYAQFIATNHKDQFVVTNHARFLSSNLYEFYDVLYCINNNIKYIESNREHANPDEYFKTEEEILNIPFGIERELVQQGMDRTEIIAQKVDVNFDTKIHFPKPDIGNVSSVDYLKDKVNKGWLERKKTFVSDIRNYKKRAKFELDAIINLGYADYFIIVSSIVDWAKEQDIMVGPGRGSAAGSLISYLLGITDVDPIKHNLLFERFLDPTGQRVNPPDIDLDFEDSRRDEVVQHIIDKYGVDKTSSIGTKLLLKLKLSIKDTAKALNIPFERANEYTKYIPYDAVSIYDLKGREIKNIIRTNSELGRLLYLAEGVRGSMKNPGTHAAGIIIAPTDITDYSPLQRIKTQGGKEHICTQLDKDDLEKLGLLKIDILGLTALSTIKRTLELIDKDINLEQEIDDKDSKIYTNILNGHCLGIFQLKSQGIIELAQKIKVASINDLRDLIALHRPGVIDSGLDDIYINNKRNNKIIVNTHDLLDPVTNETWGIILFQEQAMQASRILAGFSLAEADTLRKAIGKKSKKDIPVLKEKFLEGCRRRRIKKEEAEKIFAIFQNASYTFNQSHALSYCITTICTAWLKAYYPLEFMCSCLNSEYSSSEGLDMVRRIVNECKYNLNIKVLPPDINKSKEIFILEHDAIRYGLEAIKDIGKQFAQTVVEIQQQKEIKSFTQFVDSLKELNLLSGVKSKVGVLIDVGVFDSLERNRLLLRKQLDVILQTEKQKGKKTISKNQLIKFDDITMEDNKQVICDDYSMYRKIELERQYLGVHFIK